MITGPNVFSHEAKVNVNAFRLSKFKLPNLPILRLAGFASLASMVSSNGKKDSKVCRSSKLSLILNLRIQFPPILSNNRLSTIETKSELSRKELKDNAVTMQSRYSIECLWARCQPIELVKRDGANFENLSKPSKCKNCLFWKCKLQLI